MSAGTAVFVAESGPLSTEEHIALRLLVQRLVEHSPEEIEDLLGIIALEGGLGEGDGDLE